jgi:LemA protein
MKGLWIVLGIIGVLALIFVGLYNGLQTKDEACNVAWGQVENVLQRRFDLIPNMVEIVKGYAKHENQTFENIAKFRTAWAGAKNTAEKVEAATGLEQTLGRLMVVVENYPELKANQNFLALQDELAGTENRIAVERKRYNDAVNLLNSSIRVFPGNLVAGMAGIVKREYFKADEGAKTAPKIQF